MMASLRSGGAERALINLADGISRSGHEVELVVVNGDGPLRSIVPGHIPVIDLGMPSVRSSVPALVRYFNRSRLHAAVIAQSHLQFMALLARRISGKSFLAIVNEHSPPSRHNPGKVSDAVWRWIRNRIYSDADAITCVSEGIREDLLMNFPFVPKSRVSVIPNALPDRFFSNQEVAVPEHSFFNSSDPVVFSAGRLVPSKNFPLLLKAFAKVNECLKCRLIIAGEGPEHLFLRQMIADLGLEERVSLIGHEMDLLPFMKHAELFVLSSDYEGLPMVLLESLAAGCPVVSTDCISGPREIQRHVGSAALSLVPVRDETRLADEMLRRLKEPKHVTEIKSLDAFRALNVSARYGALAGSLPGTEKSKRVLLIGPMPDPIGGVSVHISRLLQKSAQSDWQVAVADIRKLKLYTEHKSGSSVFNWVRAWRSSDIIHLHVAHPFKVQLARLARWSGKKVVYTHHNSRLEETEANRKLITLTDRMIVVNETVAQKSFLSKSKTVVIPAFVPRKEQDSKKVQGHKTDVVRITAIATHLGPSVSVIDGKDLYGFDVLLKSISLLPGHLKPKVHVKLIDIPGRMKRMYNKELALLQAAGWKVEYDTVAVDWVASTDLFIRPTRSDGDALSVREALSAGIDVIASDAAPRPGHVFLFSNEDAGGLAERIIHLVNNPVRQVVVQPDCSSSIFSLYDELLQGK